MNTDRVGAGAVDSNIIDVDHVLPRSSEFCSPKTICVQSCSTFLITRSGDAPFSPPSQIRFAPLSSLRQTAGPLSNYRRSTNGLLRRALR